ncbi:MAG: alcohol dehydrogenase catalytic domain-containing protein, partial [Candidatus Eremiobacteraeota bacterium]|nr:alcohol dehydrogenase catalytic domain-containing protein [Candidatus Eremiobacteraeota bacterium]
MTVMASTSAEDVPRTMRALRKTAKSPGFSLDEVPVPALGPSDVLIRIEKAGICGTDVHIYKWDHWAERRIKPPLVVGHELMGRVAAIGGA